MSAYLRQTLGEFQVSDPSAIIGALQVAYASDGFASQYTRQTLAWSRVIPMLQHQVAEMLAARPEAIKWAILLEYPLYRLRRRIDLVILAEASIIVVECKVGSESFTAADERQVEEYALDLRDFHAASRDRTIIPVLWSTNAVPATSEHRRLDLPEAVVAPIVHIGAAGMLRCMLSVPTKPHANPIVAKDWDLSAYRPVPNVIEAATSIFAGHDVRTITNADADNLRCAAARLVELIEEARVKHIRYLLILTGVPGSGKTLAGLHVVHSAITTGVERQGDIVYLSGNTPLVTVLREAFARNEDQRQRRSGESKRNLKDIRREVRARIQHINDFLQDSMHAPSGRPPHEHVIVFDEAQRAWDEKQGQEKFNRTASEPALLLELMARHDDWCACVCLVGGGQEINSGEEGVLGWGEALRRLPQDQWAATGSVDTTLSLSSPISRNRSGSDIPMSNVCA